MSHAVRQLTMRLFNVREREAPAILAGLAMFFLLFAGYAMLRPVRETMGIAGGVENLQWLFTGTFVATLVALPLFGWIAGWARRRHILAWTYGFFATNLVAFAIAFQIAPDNVWTARGFYIWISVFNLLTISVAWSVLADVMVLGQAKRLFALMAGGLSFGGLVGPILGALLVGPIGHAGLMYVACLFLVGSIGAAAVLQRWRDGLPEADVERSMQARQRPMGGNPFAGATTVLRSPFLLGIAAFVLLLASVTTFLYFEQAKLIEETFPDPTRQTQVFGIIDAVVQTLALLTQFFLTGRIAQRLGIGVLLVAVPIVVAAGFIWLAFAPLFAVVRRVRGGDGGAARGRIRAGAAGARDALHRRPGGGQVQGQELHRHRGVPRCGCGERLGQGAGGHAGEPAGAGRDRGRGAGAGVGRRGRRPCAGAAAPRAGARGRGDRRHGGG